MIGPTKRAGFSLMEVLLATAILLGSILVLMELAGIGRHYVQSVEARSTAQMLCQTKLNELLAGIQPLEEIEEQVVEDDPDWMYSVEVLPVRRLPLSLLRVTVTQRTLEGTTPSIRGRPKSYSLARWVPDGAVKRRSDGRRGHTVPGGGLGIRRRAGRKQRAAAMNARTSRRGFTLLELVVSAVLVATLLVSIWGLYRMFSVLYETGFVQTEKAQLGRSLLQQLSDDLANTVPPLLEALPAEQASAAGGSFAGSPSSRLVSCAARVGLVGTYHALRLDVLQTDPGQSAAETDDESLLVPQAEAEMAASGEIVTVVYTFEPPPASEIEAAAAQPGLTRREVRFQQASPGEWEALTSLEDASSLGSPSADRSSPFRKGTNQAAPLDESREPSYESLAAAVYLPEVVALEFRYFDGQDWTDAWDSRSRRSLPTAVEVSYQLEFPSQRPGKLAAARADSSQPPQDSGVQTAIDRRPDQAGTSASDGRPIGSRFIVYVPQWPCTGSAVRSPVEQPTVVPRLPPAKSRCRSLFRPHGRPLRDPSPAGQSPQVRQQAA